MKKIFILTCFLFIISGCYKKENNVNTIIEKNSNMLVGINYPKTGNKKLDSIIKNDVEKIYGDFKKKYENFNSLIEKSELNIDYTLKKFKSIYSITIYFYVNNSTFSNPKNFVKTYNYDSKVNKLFSLENILSKNYINKFTNILRNKIVENYKKYIDLDKLNKNIIPKLNNYKFFSLDDKYLIIYFNPNYLFDNSNILQIKIEKDNLNIKINNTSTTKVAKTIENKQKILNPSDKYIALTFDDGPSIYTNEIINILKENDCNATFFVLGNKVEIYKDILIKSIKNGNEIGNHSYNHKLLTRLNNVELKNQINKTQKIIKENLGYTPTHLRPTYGSINNRIRNISDLKITLWNVDTMDWKYKSINKIIDRATKNPMDGNIILMHDTHKRTVEAVKEIIVDLKKKDFNFVTISELEEIKLLRKNIKTE